MSEAAWLWTGTACYGASAAACLWPAEAGPWKRNITFTLLIAAASLMAVALAVRWLDIGHGPFLTLYEVLLSNAFSIGLIYAVCYACLPLSRQGAVFVLPFLFALSLWAANVPATAVPLPPTFDNPWLWLHVLCGKIFLGCILTATAMSLRLLLQQARTADSNPLGRDPVRRMDALIWRMIAVAFISESFMLVAGSVWAYSAWGRYWNWDPLETWAFITWLVLAMVLHSRFTFSLAPWLGWVLVTGVFCLAFLTFFGVPFLSLAPHKGII